MTKYFRSVPVLFIAIFDLTNRRMAITTSFPTVLIDLESMKKTHWLLLTFLLFTAFNAFGQAKERKMSTVINHPSLNVYAPYISADANAVVFVTDNAEDNALTPFYSFRANADWQEPRVLPKNVYTRLNFLRGNALSADGGTLYFSTTKSPGVGGFDIWASEWKGAWANPTNLGAPINSRQHEACPSVTTDGKTMYFMRCVKMDQNKADQCMILRADRKPTGTWGDPVELPEHINTGNSQTPRIMADGVTLIFSSDKMGGKGGMDLFMTRLDNGVWSKPVPLDFVNTSGDDQYVTVAGLGRYLIRDTPGPRKSELVEYLFPEELRPRGVTKVDGIVVDPTGKPVPAYVSLVNRETGQRVYNGRPNSDGTFLLYAMEGSTYELSVDPEFGDKTFFSRVLDLTHDPIPQIEKVRAVLKTLSPGDEIELQGVSFKEFSSEVDVPASQRELQRISRLITANADAQFAIEVTLEGYQEDSLQSNPDLTEMRIDTVASKFIDIDTLGQLFERDTITTRVTYHNDRTEFQARSVVDYLISKGAKAENLQFQRSTPLPGNKRIKVRLRVVSK
jgi:hypothetical protein